MLPSDAIFREEFVSSGITIPRAREKARKNMKQN